MAGPRTAPAMIAGMWAGAVTIFSILLGLPLAAQPLDPAAGANPAGAAGTGLRLEIRGAIGPATSDYIVRGIGTAEATGASLVIIEMDTPGGLDASMRDINKAILASTVPVATFVAPAGSRAASAGTYILYASHLAVMAPATNLGAATPVQIGGSRPDERPPADGAAARDGNDDRPPQPGSAPERKAINDAVAYIRGLASLRHRNADWAERAVREAASLTAEAALREGVIDFIAPDVEALLALADGRTVQVGKVDLVLDTRNLQLLRHDPDWRTRLLATITDPNVAYILLLVGIYGLLLEGYNPGTYLPGVVGTICLLLALFAFQLLPVNFAGLGLIVLGVALFIAETFVPSFGTLGLGGIVAFVFGSILLLDTGIPGFTVSRGLIGTVAGVASLALLGLLLALVRMHRRPVVSGLEGLIGKDAEVLEDFHGSGAVFVQGERWSARCNQPVRKGDRVRIVRVEGLLLHVEPAPPEQPG